MLQTCCQFPEDINWDASACSFLIISFFYPFLFLKHNLSFRLKQYLQNTSGSRFAIVHYRPEVHGVHAAYPALILSSFSKMFWLYQTSILSETLNQNKQLNVRVKLQLLNCMLFPGLWLKLLKPLNQYN